MSRTQHVVADGRALAIVPVDDRRSTLRADLAVIPIDGIEPCRVTVFTRRGERDPLVASFLGSAKEHLRRDPHRAR
ncbi:hypothetical protein ABZV91_07845 [Nocardia sp. NPDC004568]|uniref:hypothetical protein n=1 Tax=Nocardia sp. NPDC004568 TaxID=3154551 RepID=UPI00339DEAF8